MKKLFLIVNEDRFLLSHRQEIVREAIAQHFDVTIVAKDTGKRAEVESLGARFIDLPVNPTGMNPVQELKTLTFLVRLFKREKPDIVHNVGLKCILWGALAAKLTKRSWVVNAVSGLGIMFSEEKLSFYAKAILWVLRFSDNKKRSVYIFQNSDDKGLFLKHNIATEEQCYFTKGSGVNLSEYIHTPEPESEPLVVMFTGRMVAEKGILVLADAAEILRAKYQDRVVFRLCGGLSDNPKALTEEELKSLCDGKYIQWLGHRTDIKELLQKSHIVAFPSYYREGVPKSLIEACASGRPIITTDSIGCRDVVEDKFNGYKIPIKDSESLANRLQILFEDKELRQEMGLNARRVAERDFSVENVVKTHMTIYNKVNG